MEKNNRLIKPRTRLGIKICREFVGRLRESGFYSNKFLPGFTKCLDGLKPRQIKGILCYGLGSFHNGLSVAPRYQLALLLLIYEILSDCVTEPIEIFDPHFESQDIETLKSFSCPKFHLLERNELCARALKTTTLVYMPHLDKHFYNNLVGANWTNENLGRLVLIGNSFQEMVDNTIPSSARIALHYVDLLVKNLEPYTERQRKGCSTRLKNEHRNESSSDAIIEISVAATDDELRYSFSDQSIHYLNRVWLDENKHTLLSHRLSDWQPIEDFEY